MAVLTEMKHKKQIIRELIERLAKVDATEPTDATIKISDEPGGTLSFVQQHLERRQKVLRLLLAH